MSLEPMIWVLSGDAPVADVNEYAVLGAMAETAGRDGCGTWQSKETLAERTHVSEETVKRCWRSMLRRGLIGKGDQKLVSHYRADRRPVVYDLLIPYSWFSNIDRTNAERARMGLPPLTPENRPPIAPPPTKKARADKGKPRPKTQAAEGSAPRGNSETPREETPDPRHGGTTSRRRGNYKSSTGELQDPQTSTSNPETNEPADPSVPPSFPDCDARANAHADGRTDGGEIEQQDQEQTGEPAVGAEAPTAPAAPVTSEGVALLIEAGRRDQRATLPGPLLNQWGLYVEGLLAAGWSWSELMPQITAPRPSKEKIRVSDEAVTVARIRAIPMSPPETPARGERPSAPTTPGVPAQGGLPRDPKHCCADCGAPGVSAKGALCHTCRQRCPGGCGQAYNRVRADGLCPSCATGPARRPEPASAPEPTPEEAFAALLGSEYPTYEAQEAI